MTTRKWDQRIARAQELATTHPFAAEGLRFYEHIASFQKSLYAQFESGNGAGKTTRAPGSLRDEIELFRLLPWFASFLGFIGDVAPSPLAGEAAALNAAGAARWEEVLDEFWRSDGQGEVPLTEAETFFAWIFLQPYAEHLADNTAPLEIHDTPPLCPLCNAPPQVGVLRPLGDGGKRSLVCSLCATEWDFRRIVCPTCGEENVDKLPVFVPENLVDYIRVEACDTCHHYLKTIDMTKNGHAVPVVDELAAIPLSLWAADKGYSKLVANLLGV
jgi:FdhE protein